MKIKNNNTLVFVYNADSTLKSAAIDFVTRFTTPDKYSCNLCMVTHGPIFEKKSWRKFLKTIPNEKIFLHKDEFVERYPEHKNMKLPVILADLDDTLQTLVSAEEINKIQGTEELKKLIIEKLHDE